MLTFGDLLTRFRDYTKVEAGSADETMGKSLLNYAHHTLLQAGDFDYPEKEFDVTTVADQFKYDLPPWYGTIKGTQYIDGSEEGFPLKEVYTWKQWYRLRSNGNSTTIPTHFWIVKDSVGHTGWQIWLYPTPDTSSKTIRTVFNRRVAKMTVADVVTGTVTVVNGDATVTGNGTTFTDAMVGRSILLPDGYWYDIESRTSDTSIEINQIYPSATDATGTAFILGEVPIIPEEHQDALWQYAVGTWWQSQRQFEDSAFYLGLYRNTRDELKQDAQNRTTDQIITDDDEELRHVNEYPGPIS